MCGSTEIDGHAFCLGLDFLGTEDIRAQVTFLIRRAIFRSGNKMRKGEKFSLGLYSLGELLDMYHTHGAKKPHDKVYALLGMCSDTDLRPNYSLPSRVLMQHVVKSLLGNHVSVDCWDEKMTAVMNSKGFVIGKVTKVDISNTLGGGQTVEAMITTSPGCNIRRNARWLLPISAKSVQGGDIICLLQGALKPTIVRARNDYFTIVLIAAIPLEIIRVKVQDVAWSEVAYSALFSRDFVLVWDWETSLQNRNPDAYDALMRVNSLHSQLGKAEFEIDMDNAIRMWNGALILEDAEVLDRAEK
jgi:hypothetical protein